MRSIIFKIANDKSNIYFSSESKLYETKTEIPPLNRNVYFVVLDGYASRETFKKMNKNNDNFYEYLKNNEFKFLGSKAAFNTTYLSLASIFYLDYAVQEGVTIDIQIEKIFFLFCCELKTRLHS